MKTNASDAVFYIAKVNTIDGVKICIVRPVKRDWAVLTKTHPWTYPYKNR